MKQQWPRPHPKQYPPQKRKAILCVYSKCLVLYMNFVLDINDPEWNFQIFFC